MGAIRVAWCACQELSDVLRSQLTLATPEMPNGCVLADLKPVTYDANDVVFRDVIAEIVKELRYDYVGTSSHLGAAKRIELDQETLTFRILYEQSRRNAFALC